MFYIFCISHKNKNKVKDDITTVMMMRMIIIIILPFMDHLIHIGSSLPDKHPKKCSFLVLQYETEAQRSHRTYPRYPRRMTLESGLF